VSAKKDALPGLVKAMAEFHMKLHPGPLGPAELPSPGVLELLRARQKVVKRLTAKEMTAFWLKLARRRRVQERYVDSHWASWNAKLEISDETASLAEKAAALLFTTAVNVFSNPRVVSYQMEDGGPEIKETLVRIRAEVEEKARWLRHAADVCSSAELCWRQAGNTQRADAFSLVGEYFKEQWQLNVKFDPSVVEKRGERDEVRTRVVALVTEMQRLYDRPLYEQTAEIASAALKDFNIARPQVQKWWIHRSMPSGHPA
jgi:hypothetical protein